MAQAEFNTFCSQASQYNVTELPTYSEWLVFHSQWQKGSKGPHSATQRPSSSSTPATRTCGSASVPLASVDDILAKPGRGNLTQLDNRMIGDTTWFQHDNGKISKQLLKMLKSNLPKACATYTKLPQEDKNIWFQAFAQEFNWDPSITELVKECYKLQAMSSFSSNLHAWKVKWQTTAKRPDWMGDTMLQDYIALWAEEDVMALAETNSINRNSDPDENGKSTHNAGAKGYHRIYDEMTIEEGGKEPDMIKFIERTHTSRVTGLMPNKKAKHIVEKAKESVSELVTQAQSQYPSAQPKILSQPEINAVVIKQVPLVKKRRFGFGTLLDHVTTSSPSSSIQDKDELLRKANENIARLEKDKLKQNKKIKHHNEVQKLILAQFPNLIPPPSPETDDDDYETQEY